MNKTISVSKETHCKLLSLGSKGQSFDSIIQYLMRDEEEKEIVVNNEIEDKIGRILP
jgi:predicted CopG family antitoxin